VGLEVVDAAGNLTHAHLQAEPDPVTRRGAGLWLVGRLCDEVSLEGDAGSTRLRLRVHRLRIVIGGPVAARNMLPNPGVIFSGCRTHRVGIRLVIAFGDKPD
jgi:hypothetical protein